jgi:hypothetical protein
MRLALASPHMHRGGMAKKREPIDELIDALVSMRCKERRKCTRLAKSRSYIIHSSKRARNTRA